MTYLVRESFSSFFWIFLALAQIFTLIHRSTSFTMGGRFKLSTGGLAGRENKLLKIFHNFPFSLSNTEIHFWYGHGKLSSPIVSICQKQVATSCFSFSLFIIHKKRHFGSTIRLDSTAGNSHTHQTSRTKFFTLTTLFFHRELFGGKCLKFSEKVEN